jgi:5,10-methylenetetrahydromethanopterin reductase
MDFGIALPTAADSWKVTKEAEELGFTHAWFYDTQMLSADCFVAMGAAAVNTRRIRLGTGVLVPSNRIAPVAANALATLNRLAPGRIDFGVGTGFTARRAMGFGAIKVKDMATYIHQVYGLLRRETVEFEMEGQKKKIRFLNPELPLFNTKDPIALHLSAFGPRTPGADSQAQGGLDQLRRQCRERHQGSRGHARRLVESRPCDARSSGDGLCARLRAERR